jgi:hypothetical protein
MVLLRRTLSIDETEGFKLSWGGVLRHTFKHRAAGAIFLDHVEVIHHYFLSSCACAHIAVLLLAAR